MELCNLFHRYSFMQASIIKPKLEVLKEQDVGYMEMVQGTRYKAQGECLTAKNSKSQIPNIKQKTIIISHRVRRGAEFIIRIFEKGRF